MHTIPIYLYLQSIQPTTVLCLVSSISVLHRLLKENPRKIKYFSVHFSFKKHHHSSSTDRRSDTSSQITDHHSSHLSVVTHHHIITLSIVIDLEQKKTQNKNIDNQNGNPSSISGTGSDSSHVSLPSMCRISFHDLASGGVIQLCRKIITRVTSKINSAAGFCVELRRLSTKKVTNVISGEL